MMDHLGIQVADVDAALALYLRVFAPLGLREAMRYPVGESSVVGLAGPDGMPDCWLGPSAGQETRELHIAFGAPDRAAVDAVHTTWRPCTTASDAGVSAPAVTPSPSAGAPPGPR